jgi:hypothetical protein
MKRLVILVVALAYVGTAASCAPVTRLFKKSPAAAVEEDVLLQVQNNNWSDVVVYADRSGLRVRIGFVTSMGKDTFTLPTAVVSTRSPISFVVSPIGSNVLYATERVNVAPGQLVEFEIQNQLTTSSVSVW